MLGDDYEMHLSMGDLAVTFMNLNQNDSALFYMQKYLLYRDLTGQKYDYSDYKKLSELSIEKGDYKLGLRYLDSSFIQYKEFVNNENTERCFII